MRKSYVLKEKSGLVCGFIMQTGRNLSYRVTHSLKNPVTLTAVYEGGERVSAEVKDSDEHQQEASGGALIGAYVELDGTLFMDTGKEEHLSKSRFADSLVKERRWPPPPCAPNARFLDGKWVDQSIGV